MQHMLTLEYERLSIKPLVTLLAINKLSFIYLLVNHVTKLFTMHISILCAGLLYFTWADQRIQQFYNYHNVTLVVIELWLGK